MEHRLMYNSAKKVVLIHIQTPKKNYQQAESPVEEFEAKAFDESNCLITSVLSNESALKARQLLMEKLKQLGYSYR